MTAVKHYVMTIDVIRVRSTVHKLKWIKMLLVCACFQNYIFFSRSFFHFSAPKMYEWICNRLSGCCRTLYAHILRHRSSYILNLFIMDCISAWISFNSSNSICSIKSEQQAEAAFKKKTRKKKLKRKQDERDWTNKWCWIFFIIVSHVDGRHCVGAFFPPASKLLRSN